MRNPTTPTSSRPGPRGYLLVGSLPALRRDMLGFLQETARTHGDMSFFSIGPIPCVLINDPETIARVLTKDHGHMRKSWDTRELSAALGQGLLTSEGEPWKRQRRLIQPAFHNERIRGYGAVMVDRADAMLDRWRNGATLDLHGEMARVTLDIAARTLFGTNVERDAETVGEALAVIMETFTRAITGWIPIPMHWPTPGNLRMRRAVRRIDAVIYRMADERRASGRRDDDLLSWLLEARDEQGKVGAQQFRDELITLLLAGHETTALALSWALMLLARHPEAEQKLLDELHGALGDRKPAAGDESRLQYTRQVVEESMRLYPPAWGIGREAAEPMELEGYTLAKGTQIFLSPWVTQRDPRWFPDPETFDPDRWTPERKKELPRYAYFPFGGGPRVCIGMHFATLEATLVLASIMQRFRIELDAEHPIELQPAITLRPRDGIRARVYVRSGRS